jgi:predicted membrane-bound spermidine synthase
MTAALMTARGSRDRALFVAFFLSGFCSLLYQVVWLRLAFAEFGIITPVLSVVVAVFMLGLGLGSWAGGRWIDAVAARLRISPLAIYALTEALIGAWALLVPRLFDAGAGALLGLGESSSLAYLSQSALAITAAILPGCFLMGATFPLVAAYLHAFPDPEEHSFSFLYLANVIGAMLGAALSALVVIEILGFRQTLLLGALFNWTVATLAYRTSRRYPVAQTVRHRPEASPPKGGVPPRVALTILFLTGFSSMGMEVAWTRAFTPIVTTTIYAFAFLLTTYLMATWIGSFLYRRHLASGRSVATDRLVWWLGLTGFLPLVVNDPRLTPNSFHILLSIFPVCAVLGYLTPKLIDDYARGAAAPMGKAYAVNVLGCILGPLVTGYLLLPASGVKWSLILLALPFLVMSWILTTGWTRLAMRLGSIAALGMVTVSLTRTFEDVNQGVANVEVRRDHTATVTSFGTGMDKRLLVNGIGITHLTPITKVMAHLPLLALSRRAENSLVICFGMGTTFRSLLSWGIDATAVELVPSVRDAFGFYFADAAEVMANPRGRIVIDDGRRFLKRTDQVFDLITLDPPPPVEAAGSSLLYSLEFYRDAKARLRPGGILQQWFPGGERKVLESIAAALARSFRHVRVFHSVEDRGFHFLASDDPIDLPAAAQAQLRLPDSAQRDLLEWYPGHDVAGVLTMVLSREVSLAQLLRGGAIPALSDDRPYNEYYFLRRLLSGPNGLEDVH